MKTKKKPVEEVQVEVLPRMKRDVQPVGEKTRAIFSKLIHGLEWGEEDCKRCRKFDKSPGCFQALHVEVIYGWRDGSLLVSLAHYGECNGDLMKDPDMTFVVSPEGQVYPCTYQNDWMGVFQSFMSKEDDGLKIENMRQYRDALSFTSQWMENIKWQQGVVLR